MVECDHQAEATLYVASACVGAAYPFRRSTSLSSALRIARTLSDTGIGIRLHGARFILPQCVAAGAT